MESIISTFHIDWKIIIAQAINFTIVFIVLYKYALKPLSKLMAERAEKIAKGIIDAKLNSETLTKTEQAREATLLRARVEADVFSKSKKKEAEAERAEMTEKTKMEVAKMLEAGRKTLEAEKIKIVEEAKKDIANLAMLATEKLLSTKVDSSFNEKTVNQMKHL